MRPDLHEPDPKIYGTRPSLGTETRAGARRDAGVKDWDAVAQAIDARMRELDLTQTELAVRADVAPETVRELPTTSSPGAAIHGSWPPSPKHWGGHQIG